MVFVVSVGGLIDHSSPLNVKPPPTHYQQILALYGCTWGKRVAFVEVTI